MTFWQVRADLPGGGRMLFGVQADGREAASASALQMIKDLLVPADLEITEITPPAEREN